MSSTPSKQSLYRIDQVRMIEQHALAALEPMTLMRRAAAAAFACLRERWPRARRIGVLVGSGNNGSDALLLAAHALDEGIEVVAIAFSEHASGIAATARAEFFAAGGRLIQASPELALPDVQMYVDGLFGSGLNRPIDGVAAVWIARLNAANADVLALDLPSGLDADTGAALGCVLRARVSLCFVAWKRGLFTADASDWCGERVLARLDLGDEALASFPADASLLAAGCHDVLPPRKNNVNKGTFGSVLALGGDEGMGGAIRLTAEAALRSGAGRVHVATRAAHLLAMNATRPELLVHAVDGPQSIAPLLQQADVLAVGPGLGQAAWGHALWDAALQSQRPLVLDADGLNLLARHPGVLPAACVLTPHPGEAARLLGCDVASIQRDRFAAVRALAKRYGAVVVLKGSGSVIADPDGRVAVCPFGNPGMASAGMGDLLTGVIAALLAQGLSAWDAACVGVVVHARAGDHAAAAAPRGLIASDLLAPLRLLVNECP